MRLTALDLLCTSPDKLACRADILELALLQYWRHVSFYLDADRAAADSSASSRPDVGLGLAGSLKARKDPSLALSVSQFDLPSLREDLADEFNRLGDRLTALQGQFVRLFHVISCARFRADDLDTLTVSEECRRDVPAARGVRWGHRATTAGASLARSRGAVGPRCVCNDWQDARCLLCFMFVRGDRERGGAPRARAEESSDSRLRVSDKKRCGSC